MDRLGRKRWHTNGDVLGGFVGSRILNPFSRMGHNSLARRNLEGSSLMTDAKPPVENDGVLLKFRGLSRFLPARGAGHVRYTDAIFLRIHTANLFVDDLGQVACSLDAGWLFDQSRQNRFS